MNKLYFICDESGAKGFANNEEQFEGEFGVFAGYFLTEDKYELAKNKFEAIYNAYAVPGKKLHITDLSPENQQNLRGEVFECLISLDIQCAYEAISVKGYNREYVRLKNVKSEQREELADKFSFSNNNNKDRLHSELFQALFGKAIAYYIDTIGEEANIQVITDNIDAPLKKEFELKAKELIKPFEKPIQFKAFDKVKKQRVAKNMMFSSEHLNDNFSKTQFTIVVEDNFFTLIADIVANSLLYYLKKSVTENPDVILNSSLAIKSHPISRLFYGLSTDTFTNSVSDGIYGRSDE